MRFLAAVVNLVILAVGGFGIMRGTIELGTLVAFFTYTNALFWPMFAMGWVVSLYQRGTASLDRINRILHTRPLVRDEGGSSFSGNMRGKIEFVNLDFSYNHQRILHKINLTIEPGRTVGLVGMTGSGKSTLVSLLGRLYPVERGRILIDGVDINDWQLASLRRQIAFATQEPFLFSESIGENIRFGRSDATGDEIVAAAEAAALAKDVNEFPRAYDTIVGERGVTLSGGQKQRTAIARALLTDPAVLILDDATSSVDTETENEIYDQVRRNYGHRTRIIISHRVSSVKDADRIFYLDNGRVAEQGSHEELLALDGSYAELYRSQLLEIEIEAL
jgi:ATP-binding cassette subfamily B protein